MSDSTQMILRIASRWIAAGSDPTFKSKKTIKTQDGKKQTVYEYSDRQLALRDNEKASRLEDLKKKMPKLTAQVKKDLDSKDSKLRLTALAIGLITETFERVGNTKSAEENEHYGVTGWLKKHLKFSQGGKATVSYVGKSGVEHTKTIEDTKLVSALKSCCADKSPDDPILSFGKEDVDGIVHVSSTDVNAYLEPYAVTAKDLRGWGANSTMQEHLRAVRKAGGKLPTDKKEREKKLKEEFTKALEDTAEAVGHSPTMCKNSYLVPGMEDQYLKDGTVIESLKKKGSDSDQVPHQMIDSLRAIQHMLLDARSGKYADSPELVSHVIPLLLKEVNNVDFCFTGKRSERHVDDDEKAAQALLTGERGHWEVYLSDGGYSRWVLHGIYAQGTTMHFDPGLAGQHARRIWDMLVVQGYGTTGGHIKMSCTLESLWGSLITATLSPSEKEDREAERLVRTSPKFKPPRKDLQRNTFRPDTEKDPDEEADKKDRSLNFKDN